MELRAGRYVLVRALGEGSQGQTFEAIDRGSAPKKPVPTAGAYGSAQNLGEKWSSYVERAKGEASKAPSSPPPGQRVVAIKCFRVGKAKAWKDVELAEREARTLASLDHPHLPKYIEHFEEDGALYLVMEKIEGESLAAIRKERSLGTEELTRMLEDIGEALRYLHGRAPFIVHRDIKPGNVIRRPDGSYALVDFGAVRDRLKPAGGSTVVGTFGYMAPEQFQGRASPKSDVYGLGATAIAMLTGIEPEELPHDGLAIDVERAVPRGTSPALVRALKAMLVPDPDKRAGTVDEALAFLRTKKEEKSRRARSEKRDTPKTEHLSRRQKRELKLQRRRAEHEERRRRRAEARARAAPFLPRIIGQLGLVMAMMVVWMIVGFAVPLLLTVLSLIFGASLRRGAAACVGAAKRAQGRLGNAFIWLSGHRAPDPKAEANEVPRLRVPAGLDDMMPIDQDKALRIAIAREDAKGIDPDEWIAKRLAEEAEKEAGSRVEERLRMVAPNPRKRD